MAKAAAGVKRGGRAAAKGYKLAEKFPPGEELTDVNKKVWKLGDIIGQGGFGMIYLAQQADSGVGRENYVIKIEPQLNGPLFCEFNFYNKFCKPDLIDDYVKSKKLQYLGIPKLIGFGIHEKETAKYRFIVIPRFSLDLQEVLKLHGCFKERSVFAIALRVLDALAYIHSNGFVHADIKASNLLLGYNGKTDPNKVYLTDYGLATKYTLDGKHKDGKEDKKRAHDGTLEFTSVDAHCGRAPSRRGDLEILGYCMLHWLNKCLPWSDQEDKEKVKEMKMMFLRNESSFPENYQFPDSLKKYFKMVKKLDYDECPAYNEFRDLLAISLVKSGGQESDWSLYLPTLDVCNPEKPTRMRKSLAEALESEIAVKKQVKSRSSSAKPRQAKITSPQKCAGITPRNGQVKDCLVPTNESTRSCAATRRPATKKN